MSGTGSGSEGRTPMPDLGQDSTRAAPGEVASPARGPQPRVKSWELRTSFERRTHPTRRTGHTALADCTEKVSCPLSQACAHTAWEFATWVRGRTAQRGGSRGDARLGAALEHPVLVRHELDVADAKLPCQLGPLEAGAVSGTDGGSRFKVQGLGNLQVSERPTTVSKRELRLTLQRLSGSTW